MKKKEPCFLLLVLFALLSVQSMAQSGGVVINLGTYNWFSYEKKRIAISRELNDGSIITMINALDTSLVNDERPYILLSKMDTCGDVVWQKTFSHNNTSYNGYDLIVLNEGNIIIGGTAINDQGWFPLLMKLDQDGNIIWLTDNAFPNDNQTWILDLTESSNKVIYSSAYCWIYDSDQVITKYDSLGIYKICKYMDYPTNVTSEVDLRPLFAPISDSLFYAFSPYDAGSSHYYVSQLNAQCEYNWFTESVIPGSLQTMHAGLVTSDSGLIISAEYIAGFNSHSLLRKISAQGSEEWSKNYDTLGVVLSLLFKANALDFFATNGTDQLFCFDSSGNKLWQKSYSSLVSNNFEIHDVHRLNDGNYLVTGKIITVTDDQTLLLFKIDSLGNPLNFCSVTGFSNQNISEPDFTITPNPASGKVSIYYNLPEGIHSAQLRVLDLVGNEKDARVLNDNKSSVDIDISQWSIGVYLCEISTIKDVVSKKIVKIE